MVALELSAEMEYALWYNKVCVAIQQLVTLALIL